MLPARQRPHRFDIPGLGQRLRRIQTELIVRGAKAEIPTKEENGLLVFDPPELLPRITTEQVRRLAEEQ
jgi:hypothetical protein